MAAKTNEPTVRPKHPELNGTVVVYSPYINRQKTIQEVIIRQMLQCLVSSDTMRCCMLMNAPNISQGRRIPQELACDDPTAWEIMEVCKRLFPETAVEGENKGYSRDYEAQWPVSEIFTVLLLISCVLDANRWSAGDLAWEQQ